MIGRFAGIVKSALAAAMAFKLRSFFCILSVALGVSSITLITASVEGAYQKAYDLVDKFGPDSVLVFGGGSKQRAVGRREKTLTLDDVKAIKESFPSAYLVTPMASEGGVNITYEGNHHQTRVVGSSEDYSLSWTWPVEEGTDFSPEDVKGSRKVCLLGSFVAKKLFGNRSPVGKFIQTGSIPCRVIGVLSERGSSQMGQNLDDRVVMPITTVMKKFKNDRKYISLIRVRFTEQEHLHAWIEELKDFLRLRHGIRPDDDEDFRIVSSDEIIKFLVALTGSLIVFLGVSGIVSLVVSGFVLANLFLLSVRERTREIGIRRALGAKKRDIFLQFVMESTVITCAGGVAGFLLGLAAKHLLVFVAEFPLYFSWKAFVIGVGLALAVGVVFGVQPARRAAALKPIEAIR